MNSRLTRCGFQVIAPALISYSLFLLWRGHHEPGGGFAGGLVAGMAVIVWGFANDFKTQSSHNLILGLMGAGLLVLFSSAILGNIFSESVLQGLWIQVSSLKLGTPLLFDAGVYLVVVTLCALAAHCICER